MIVKIMTADSVVVTVGIAMVMTIADAMVLN